MKFVRFCGALFFVNFCGGIFTAYKALFIQFGVFLHSKILELLNNVDVRESACECLQEIVNKGEISNLILVFPTLKKSNLRISTEKFKTYVFLYNLGIMKSIKFFFIFIIRNGLDGEDALSWIPFWRSRENWSNGC